MYILFTILHIIACAFLILVILLQAGRGGGLSEMFGGGGDQAQKMFGTQTNVFLVRLTTGAATLFIITSVTLAVISASRGKSLLRGQMATQALDQQKSPLKGVLEEEGSDVVAEVEKAVKSAEEAAPAEAIAPGLPETEEAPSPK